MKAIITDHEALSAVSVLAIHSYLKSQRWEKGDDLGNRGVVYQANNGIEVFAPGTDRLGDYAQSVSILVTRIAAAEDRDEMAVYRDLVTSDRDLIRFRAPEADDDGSIDLVSGVDLVRQSKDALLAAACSAVSPQRFFRSGSNAKANDYLKTVRLGQTEQGSFVVNLYSPVPPQLNDGLQGDFWPDMDNDPFNRQVTRTLGTAIDSIIEAIEKVGRGADIKAFEGAVSKGVSANLCAAVSNFISYGDGLDFSISWARTRPTPELRLVRKFAQSDSEILSEAARVLKDRQPLMNEVLEGYVTGLNRELAPTEGRIKLKTFVDGHPRSVIVELPSDLYSKAIEAHESKAEIHLEGDLEFEGRRWYLKLPRNLEIIEEKEED